MFVTRSGLRLAADAAGDPGASAVIVLHGGGQTRHSWGHTIDTLAAGGFYAVALDLRGHGDSDWSPEGRYDPYAIADDLLDVIAALPGALPVLVGASLGGLTAMVAIGEASIPPARALVLVDIVPIIEAEGTAEIRAFMSAYPEGFASPAEAAGAVAAYLPGRARPADDSGLRKNLRLQENGRYRWHWDPRLLEIKERLDPSVPGNVYEAAATRIAVPTLLIRGSRSRVVGEAGMESLRRAIPHCTLVTVADAHHMVAGDANDAFAAPLLDFCGTRCHRRCRRRSERGRQDTRSDAVGDLQHARQRPRF